MAEEPETPPGGGGSQVQRPKKRKTRILREERRCLGRLPKGRRCEAARLRHSMYCVFHDPEMQQRRMQLAESIPYEHPDEVQRLLGEVVQGVKRKRLSPRAGNTLGYLATLLAQNQPRVGKERERVNRAQYGAELQAAVDEIMTERAERLQAEAQAKEAHEAGEAREEKEADGGGD